MARFESSFRRWGWVTFAGLATSSAMAADHVVHPGQSIQAAIDQANDGDRVLVQPGIYFEIIDYRGLEIEVIGVGGAAATTLDGTGKNDSVVTFDANETNLSILRGFTLRGGVGKLFLEFGPNERRGGAIYCGYGTTPTIEQCVFTQNTATRGGAAYTSGPSLTFSMVHSIVRECVFDSNVASFVGGATVGPVEFERCTFRKNQAPRGGAHYGNLIAEECVFEENSAVRGGAISNDQYANEVGGSRLLLCRFIGNVAQDSFGAAYLSGNYIGNFHWIQACEFSGNRAIQGSVGGLYVTSYSNDGPLAFNGIVDSCLFRDNFSATAPDGLVAWSDVFTKTPVSGCTVYGDQVSVEEIYSSIFANEMNPFTGVPSIVKDCILPIAWPGAGNSTADPLFVDPQNGDFHITQSSPAFNSSSDFLKSPIDLDGAPRFSFGAYDRGCYEVQQDCDGDGTLDWLEIAAGTDSDCNGNKLPDSCEVFSDCNGNGIFDACDIANGTATDCNQNKIPDSCDLVSGADVDGDGTIDACQYLLVPQKYPSISNALSYAKSGDVIIVDDGIYSGPGNTNLDFAGKGLILRSRRGPEHCILDGAGANRVFDFDAPVPAGTVVEGFTIRNSTTSTSSFAPIYVRDSAPTFRRCIVTGNSAQRGGAVLATVGAKPTFDACVFLDNSASDSGGAVFANFANTVVTLRRCSLVGNTANLGGALFAMGKGTIVVQDCILANNTATSGNEAYATQSGSSIMFTRSLVESGAGGIVAISNASVTFGPDNLSGDPRFLAASDTDVHLLPDSPARDAGTLTMSDFEGDSPLGAPDLGADEFAPHLYVAGVAKPNGEVEIVAVGHAGTTVLAFASTKLLLPAWTTPFGAFGLGAPLLPASPVSLGVIHGGGHVHVTFRVDPTVPVGTTLHVQALLLGNTTTWSNVATIRVE